MKNKLIELKSSNTDGIEIKPKYIILHCIGYSEEKAINLLTKPNASGGGASSHYFIPQLDAGSTHSEYPVYHLVPDNRKARHAGQSYWDDDTELNNMSIGIEFHSPNYANAMSGGGTLDWFHFEPFDQLQIEAGRQVIAGLIEKYGIQPNHILGHSDIAPYRGDKDITLGKTDPGATFPWQSLAQQGIGVWPKSERKCDTKLDLNVANIQRLLAAYGYRLEVTGQMDLKTELVIKAFQLHFMPKQCDGLISEEMVVRLENLIDGNLEYQPLVQGSAELIKQN